MTSQTRAIHYFSAFALTSTAVLFRLLGVFDMSFSDALSYLGTIILLTASFIGSIWLFGKLLETILKKVVS
jgi:hypothetical protein